MSVVQLCFSTIKILASANFFPLTPAVVLCAYFLYQSSGDLDKVYTDNFFSLLLWFCHCHVLSLKFAFIFSAASPGLKSDNNSVIPFSRDNFCLLVPHLGSPAVWDYFI